MLCNFGTAHHASCVARQILQQRIFFCRENDLACCTLGGLRSCIEHEIRNGDFLRAQLAGAPQQSSQAREQFAKFEWLCKIVVRAMIQTSDAVFYRVRSEEHTS